MSIVIGERAPEFSLLGHDGRFHSLSEFRGKRVVLYFYPKDDTPGCTKEACKFRDHIVSGAVGSDVVVLGVSPDDMRDHLAFREKYALPFTLLSDPNLNTLQEYGAWGEKMLYGKSVEGVIRSTVVIDENGIVVAHWAQIRDAEVHPDEVLAFLQGGAAPTSVAGRSAPKKSKAVKPEAKAAKATTSKEAKPTKAKKGAKKAAPKKARVATPPKKKAKKVVTKRGGKPTVGKKTAKKTTKKVAKKKVTSKKATVRGGGKKVAKKVAKKGTKKATAKRKTAKR